MFSCRDKHIRKKYSRPCTTLWKGFSRNVSLWYSMCSLKTLSDIIDLLHQYHFKCVEKDCPLNVSLWKLKLLQSVWHQIVSDRWSGKPQRHILWPLLWKKRLRAHVSILLIDGWRDEVWVYEKFPFAGEPDLNRMQIRHRSWSQVVIPVSPNIL